MIKKSTLLLVVLLLTTLAQAVGLDGRNVILLVSQHRSGDPRMEAVRRELLKVRDEIGLSKEEMPIVFMGFEDSDTEREYFDRLGFQAFDSPVLCVAKWGNPARFGPKQVVDYAIARSATPGHVDHIVGRFLDFEGKSSLKPVRAPRPSPTPDSPSPSPSPEQTPEFSRPGQISIVRVRFEASGKPMYMTNVGVRIQNDDDHTLRGIKIRFYKKIKPEDEWNLMGEKTLEKLPAGYFATRDLVGDSRKFDLVNEGQSAIPCWYRIEVEQGGQVISEEGHFVPSEGPVS